MLHDRWRAYGLRLIAYNVVLSRMGIYAFKTITAIREAYPSLPYISTENSPGEGIIYVKDHTLSNLAEKLSACFSAFTIFLTLTLSFPINLIAWHQGSCAD